MTNNYISGDEIRAQFSLAITRMYQAEVQEYAKLSHLVAGINAQHSGIKGGSETEANTSYHGAIRLGSPEELSTMRRLFAVMAMLPVDYYDLSSAGIPVHATAFRAVDLAGLTYAPFRMFTSLLRLDLIDDERLASKARKLLSQRNLFSAELLALMTQFEKQGGLLKTQVQGFIEQALAVFRWQGKSLSDKQSYDKLSTSHRIIADIVCFPCAHINHLTLRAFDIDSVQAALPEQGFQAKASIEGPPLLACPILLRQTSFMAVEEKVVFNDKQTGIHAARFGEIEQRGIALTPKGRKLYDESLQAACNKPADIAYQQNLEQAFKKFPDTHEALHEQGLAYYQYKVKEKVAKHADKLSLKQAIQSGRIELVPIIYEDFLPVSAAGIFKSNLQKQSYHSKNMADKPSSSQSQFEQALGATIINSADLYAQTQANSLRLAREKL